MHIQKLVVDECVLEISVCQESGHPLGRPLATFYLDEASRLIVGTSIRFSVAGHEERESER